VSLDLLVPFGILLVLVVFLIYSRTKFEKDVVVVYEEKFEEWKKHSETKASKEEKSVKQLAGLVYKTGYKVSIELIDESAKNMLEKGKFEISDIKDK
jgi:hypothetical protein